MVAPLELGLMVAGAHDLASSERSLAQVERAEALGFHSVWLPEMHFTPGATPTPLLHLAAFAARTRHLRLGTTSLLLPLHSPVRIAAEVATLDQISGGRVWLGMGRGFRAHLFEAFGIEPATKRDRFDEVLDRILEIWSNTDGGGIPPAQRPHPPLLVAAFGRKGLLQAARRGLPYLASPLESLATLEENYAFHRDHLSEGVAVDRLPVPVIRTVHVAGSDSESRRVMEALARTAPPAPARIPAALARAAQGPPQARVLVGTASQVSELVAEYRERIGLDLLIARGEAPGATPAESEASLERLRGDVLPRFR